MFTDPSKGKRIPQRWYIAVSEQNFDQSDMPAEWDGKLIDIFLVNFRKFSM